MSGKYNNGYVGIGDPVEVKMFQIMNIRGGYRVSWIPATVVGTSPHVTVAYADGSRHTLHPQDEYRIPSWRAVA